MTTNRSMVKVTMWVSKTHGLRIRNAAEKQMMPMSRIVGLAFDAEMERNPALKYELELPSVDEYIEYAFAAEAGKVLDYIKKLPKAGLSIDLLYILRHDIGISDKEILFGAFTELIQKGFVKETEPPNVGSYTYPEDYKYYAIPKNAKQTKEDREYQKYLKLQKKFEKNEETKG